MHIMYFTERPYRHVSNDEIIKNGFFGLPNQQFDAQKGAQLLNEYLDEKTLAEELGFDGVMLNEHHDTAFCMGSVMNVEASILARITKRVKIILLGNPLPVVGNPLRLAEELSMIDMISGGRLVTGWVRGAGSEQFATNANPGYNRELFNEAHDLVVDAWTKPGPWRYEGKHFHYRFVDPWVLPLQKPHPPIWIPGLLSPETVIWCAQHRYPYVALATFLEPTVELWNIYRDAAAKEGYQVGPENFGYLQKVFVAETEEKAHEIAKWDMFGGAGIGYSLFGQPQWMFPPGYNSKEATRRVARQFSDPNAVQGSPFGGFAPSSEEKIAQSQIDVRAGAWTQPQIDVAATRKKIFDAFPQVERSMQVICGTPKSVIPKIRKVLEVLRPGIFGFWQNDGPISAADRVMNMRLIANEVMPATREIANELGLVSPFDVKPGSRPLPASGVPESVGSLAPLAS
ncbi:MAG: LLM class flavin-dependent oxidoreductase [Candidatus Binatus sp.]|uniref:LLM class flavin-dependent oxidoreductase n=1 Tax=Candidatus Binatus sp. TaxID=2811406 RepID=UPI00272554A8|nr:LLM class flavin-dependent oxidoreductase [Candidatus Binatus sp.]MDO8434344.1 LLM class flavin-dependent oxidoreductase [Candidatus Binatus sp.]